MPTFRSRVVRVSLTCVLLTLGLSPDAGAEPPVAPPATPPDAEPAQESPAAAVFSFDTVIDEARALAARPHDPTPPPLPEALKNLTYDEFRRIIHWPQDAVWADEELPFTLTFFHRGWLAQQKIEVVLVEGEEATPLPYRGELFEYRELELEDLPGDLGYAGLRVLYPLNRPDKIDEIVAFLGASYFRPLAKGLHYGLSLRGLAVDTGLPTGEEFPAFTKFWIQKPAADATTITLYALLDSKSIAGAYRFTFHPGDETLIEVENRLFPRMAIRKLGIAPLTSMYLYGEGDLRPPYDFRPEVHDSDGLLVHSRGGEWIWRPLGNPRATRISQFLVGDLAGYGLLQRDREYAHYEDTEAMYNARPSAWVEPVEGFGSGKIDLLEIASDDEGMDNVVAAFVADEPVLAGQELSYQYRVHISDHGPSAHAGGKATATRRMWRPEGFAHKTITVPEGWMRFLIEFDGPPLRALDAEAVEKAETMELVVGAHNAEIGDRVVHYNRPTGTWRAFLDVRPEDQGRGVDIRAFLRNGDDVLTETWTYLWNP